MLKKVGATEILAKHKATCHCGAVELEIELPEGIVDPRHCDCSICRRKGAVVASVLLSGIKIVKGENVLKMGVLVLHRRQSRRRTYPPTAFFKTIPIWKNKACYPYKSHFIRF